MVHDSVLISNYTSSNSCASLVLLQPSHAQLKKSEPILFFKIAVRNILCLKKDFYYNCVRFLFNRVLGEKKRQEKKKTKKYFDINAYSNNCWFAAQKQKTNEIFAYTRPCSSFTMLESSFSTIHSQKICSFVLKILKLLVFKIKVFSLTLLLANISTQKIKKTFRFPTLWKFEFLLTLFLN